jgi:hypothetical protein
LNCAATGEKAMTKVEALALRVLADIEAPAKFR